MAGQRRCSWLESDGSICDRPLPAGELFCASHPGGPHLIAELPELSARRHDLAQRRPGRPRRETGTTVPDPVVVTPDVYTPGDPPVYTPDPLDPGADEPRNPLYLGNSSDDATDPVLAPAVIDHPQIDRRRRGELEAAYYASLCAIGQQNTPDGLLVAYLARQLDDGLTATAIATVAQRLMLAADKVFAGRPPTPDALDELSARRRRRVANDE